MKYEKVIIFGTIFAGALLRIYRYWHKPLWADEILDIYIYKFDFQVLQNITIWIFKKIAESLNTFKPEFVIRAPYVLLSAISILIFHKICSRFEKKEKILLILFFSSSFFLIILNQDATGWSICSFFYLLTIYEFIKIDAERKGNTHLFLIFSILCFFSKEISIIWIFPFVIQLVLSGKLKVKTVFTYVALFTPMVSIYTILSLQKIDIEFNKMLVETIRNSFSPNLLSLETYLDSVLAISGSWWSILSYIQISVAIFGLISFGKTAIYFFVLPNVLSILVLYYALNFFSTRYLLPISFAYLLGLSKGIARISSIISRKTKISELFVILLLSIIPVASNMKTLYEYWKFQTSFFLPLDARGISEKLSEIPQKKISIRIISQIDAIKISIALGLDFYLREKEITIIEPDRRIPYILKHINKRVENEYPQDDVQTNIVLIPLLQGIDAGGILKWWHIKEEEHAIINQLSEYILRLADKLNIQIVELYQSYRIVGIGVKTMTEKKFKEFEYKTLKFITRKVRN